MPIPDPIRNSRLSMRLLRNAPVPVFLLVIVGGILLTVGVLMDDHATRPDSFAVLGGKKAQTVVRLDVPEGWRVKQKSLKNGTATALFTPEDTFAFEVARGNSGGEGEVRNGPAGEKVVVIRRDIEDDSVPRRWRVASDGRPVQVTYSAGPQKPCVRFTMRGADADRLEPEAFRIFLTAESLAPDDPRADSRVIDEVNREWKNELCSVGLGMLIAGGVLVFAVPWLSLYFVVREAAAGSPGLRLVERPPLEEKVEAQLEAVERGSDGLAALGFEHALWFRLDDFDETHVSAWRHPTNHAVAFVLYLPITNMIRLRIVRRFPDGWLLITSTRLADLSYSPPPHVHLQVRRDGTAADLWAWHGEAEHLFPPRSAKSAEAVPSPIEVYRDLMRRIARHHRRVWLWFLRYDPFGECWRMFRRRGVSVQEQINRGWATDPATTFPEPDRVM